MAACGICSHPRVREINRWLLNGRQEKATAKEFKLVREALANHKRKHLPWRHARAKKPVTIAEKMADLGLDLERLQILAEAGELVHGALAVVQKRIALLELEARMEGSLDAAHKKMIHQQPAPVGDHEVIFERGKMRTVLVEKGE